MNPNPPTLQPGTSVQTICTVLVAVLLVIMTTSCRQPPKLDGDLCPADKPPARQTILLLDISDPLTPKHKAELKRLVSELQHPKSDPDMEDFYVAPGEALIVYKLAADWQNIKPFIRVCNPGERPDDWDWKKSLTRGKIFALHNWKRFEERVKELFPDDSRDKMELSPILENLSVIVPHHAPSQRNLPADGPGSVHLIVFSDLLQHSDLLSHYAPYPKVKDWRGTPKLRELATDLTGVKVTLFRLERSEYSRWQTRDHYYWWSHLVEAFGGELRWQEAL